MSRIKHNSFVALSYCWFSPLFLKTRKSKWFKRNYFLHIDCWEDPKQAWINNYDKPFYLKKKMYISLPTYTLLEVKKYLKEMHLTKQSIKFSSTTSAWSELIVTDMLSGSHDNNIQNNIMLKQRRQSGYE